MSSSHPAAPLLPPSLSPTANTTPRHVVFGTDSSSHEGNTPVVFGANTAMMNNKNTTITNKSIRSARDHYFVDLSQLTKTQRGNPHALEVSVVLKILETDPTTGLSSKKATELLEQIGPNTLAEKDQETFLHKVWRQLKSILILILFVAAIISGALQEWAEFGLILGVITINTIIGLVQEGKADRATAALKDMLSNDARVIRDGKNITIKASELVPGDVVELIPGDLVPADLRLVSVSNLSIEEAALTGEAIPVNKHTKKVDFNKALADRKCMAFSGTAVKSGKGIGIVTATGDTTQIGLVNMLASMVENKPTELEKQVDQFGWWIAIIVLPLGVASFLLEFFTSGKTDPVTGEMLSDGARAANSFVVAIAIAVAVVPEGLPAILSITLALGQRFMAENNAIVKTLPAVETLGSVMVVCSDKTGTLTRNEMTVVGIVTANAQYKVTGVGYSPKSGQVLAPDYSTDTDQNQNGVVAAPLSSTDPLNSILANVVLCTDGNSLSLSPDQNKILMVGNPTEAAIVSAAWKAHINVDDMRTSHVRLGEIPFDSEYKFMATFYQFKDEEHLTMFLKGAPDRVFARCNTQSINNTSQAAATAAAMDHEFWTSRAAHFSEQGLRCIAFARALVPKSKNKPMSELCKKDFVLDGEPFLEMVCLFAIMDPARPECTMACHEARRAGVTVKMITGDHPSTAVAIGKALGIVNDDTMALTGPEVDAMTPEQLAAVVLKCNIYARASPQNKIQIVQALQANKQVCSMTGDGVNDAPALKAADIGVGMGITGTAVSRDAANIILKDDNFATIIVAIKEGRRVYDNLRKILIFNQPANFAQGLIVFFALAFQFPQIPLTAIQILYVNLVTSVTLGLFLAMEPAETDVMSRPPRRPGKRLVGRMFLWRCFWVSLTMVAFCLGAFVWVAQLPENIWPLSQCMQYNCTNPATNETYGEFYAQVLGRQRAITMNVLVFAEIAYSLNCRFLIEPSLSLRVFRGNWVAWACVFFMSTAQVFIIYCPGVNGFFAMAPLSGPAWGITFLFGGLTFLLVELEKALIIPVWRPYISPLLFPTTGKEQEPKQVKALPSGKLQGGSMRALSPEELEELNV